MERMGSGTDRQNKSKTRTVNKNGRKPRGFVSGRFRTGNAGKSSAARMELPHVKNIRTSEIHFVFKRKIMPAAGNEIRSHRKKIALYA